MQAPTDQSRSAFVLIFTMMAILLIWFFAIRFDTRDEIAVYDAALRELGVRFLSPAPVILSMPETCELTPDRPGVSNELLVAFLTANRSDQGPIDLSALRGHADVLTLKSAKALAGHPFIANAKGIRPVVLSRVGFSNSRRSALFCANGPGGTMAFVLERGETWRLTKSLVVGIQ